MLRRKNVIGAAILGGLAFATFELQRQIQRQRRTEWEAVKPPDFEITPRSDHIQNMKKQTEYDFLVIGGGATGTGIALDAATRGYSVALVERDDFGSGTSSRSTKLVHGGVRYLEKAFRNLDKEQYDMVTEALHERKNFLKIAPHLSYELPIMIPVFSWFNLPYYWVGAKVYDLLAGRNALQSSYLMSKASTLEVFPHLSRKYLKGSIVYYDGAHNDARMNVSLAVTAALEGADIANHVEVVELHKNAEGQLCGATLCDRIAGDRWDVKAKVIINATGPFTDFIRKLDDVNTPNIVCPSSGIHVILPDYYSPKHMGLLDPATSDGRVIFFLPWQNSVIAGTTDAPTEVSASPVAKEEEIRFILKEISSYLSPDIQVRRTDVLSAWSGIRPLVRDPSKSTTEGLARNHIVTFSPSGLVTVAGGKWTTYRRMASDTIDAAITRFKLQSKKPCQTEHVMLIGAHAYNPTLKIKLTQQYGLDSAVSEHLVQSYGDRAFLVAEFAKPTGKRWPVNGNRIAEGYPYIEGEIVYGVRNEMACTIVDVLARRTRLAFLNATASMDVIPKIGKIMQQELGWDKETLHQEMKDARKFLFTMGYSNKFIDHLSAEELDVYLTRFNILDGENSDGVTLKQVESTLDELHIPYEKKFLPSWFKNCSFNNSTMSFTEFVELVESIKTGNADVRYCEQENRIALKTTERSGGGV